MKFFPIPVLAVALTAMPVLAETHAEADFSNLVRARDITGGNVYTTDQAYDEGAWVNVTYDAVGGGWNNIGEIEDVVLDRDGKLVGIVAEVGGFLDVADKHVLLGIEDVKFVPSGDDGTYSVVTRWNEEELEQLSSVDEGWWE